MNTISVLRNLIGLLLIISVSACGGGGGGGSDTNPSNVTYIGGSGLTVSTNTVTETFERFGSRLNSGLTVRWNSLQVSSIVVITPTGVAAPSWLNVSFTGNRTPVSLGIGIENSNLAVGTYQTIIRVITVNLTQQPMDFEDITVNFEVKERPTATPETITVNMVEGELPDSQTVSLARPNDTVSILSSSFLSGFINWAGYSINGESIDVNFNSQTQALAVGSYSSTLQIDYNGGRRSIPLNVNVTSALSVPSAVNFTINQNSQATDKTSTITIASNQTSSISWNASFSESWMTLSTSSGDTTTTDNLILSLVQTELDKLTNGTYTGNITVSSSDSNVSDTTIPVTLTLTTPEVTFVSPSSAVSSASKEVIIRGFGFSSLAAPVVSFGGNTAVSMTVVSDTEIRATHGGLNEADYAVDVSDGGVSLTSYATLKVRDALGFSPLWITNSAISIIDGLLFDMTKEAVFFRRSGSLVRYQFRTSDASWQPSFTSSETSLRYAAIAMSPNGDNFFTYNEPEHIFKYDTTTLGRTTISNASNSYSATVKHGAMANNGKMILSSIRSILSSDVAINNAISTTSLLNQFSGPTERLVKASLDGSRVYVVSNTSSALIQTYNASTDTLVASSIFTTASSLSVDRTGDTLIVDAKVYDASFNLLGTLPTSQAYVVSPDGQTAYTFNSDSSGGQFRKYDLTTSDGSGGFTQVGAVSTIAGNALTSAQMTIAPDSGTLFVVGPSTFIVFSALYF